MVDTEQEKSCSVSLFSRKEIEVNISFKKGEQEQVLNAVHNAFLAKEQERSNLNAELVAIRTALQSEGKHYLTDPNYDVVRWILFRVNSEWQDLRNALKKLGRGL
jgi:hypothetical protein